MNAQTHVSPPALQCAALKIFWDFRVPAGSGLGHATLVKEWPRTHLPRRELGSALRSLVESRCVVTERRAEGEFVVLTQTGHERAAVVFSGLFRRFKARLQVLLRPRDFSAAVTG